MSSSEFQSIEQMCQCDYIYIGGIIIYYLTTVILQPMIIIRLNHQDVL